LYNSPLQTALPDLSQPMAVDAASAEPLDLVFIDGLVGHTVIGIHDNELYSTQPVRIDVCAGLPRPRACLSDEIVDTIDYSLLRARLIKLLEHHDIKLLEAFAEEIARIVLHEFGAHWTRVRLVKPRKFDDVDAVGVQIERRRHVVAATSVVEPGGSAASRGPAMLRLIGAGMVPEASARN
jgi:7,8-dihydroneopterin aldolase/epimerase/oxygenase